MLISPSGEPDPIKALGKTSSLPEKYGADILMLVKDVRVGVQRKAFPNDLLASLSDGRLYDQIRKMGALNHAVLVIEGFGQWTADGVLMHQYTFTRDQLHGLMLSMSFEFGIQVLQVRDMGETVQLLTNMEKWLHKPAHTSLLRRPGPSKDSWGEKSDRLNGIHLLQSFPGVGPTIAARIYDHFGRVPLQWEEGVEFTDVPGVGKEKARQMEEAL
jgi:ERCC4-type nuclease